MDMMTDIEIYNEDAGALSATLFSNLIKTKEQNKKNPALLCDQNTISGFGLQDETWSNRYIYIATEIGTEERKSPFEELYDKQPPEDKIRGAIEKAKRFNLSPHKNRITNRLQYLLEITLDDPEENGINPESLNAFLAFMESIKRLKYPDITLSPAGNITVRWRKDINRNLCIEFLSAHDAQFVVFAPNPIRTLRITGIIPIDELWNVLKPYQVNRWVVNK